MKMKIKNKDLKKVKELMDRGIKAYEVAVDQLHGLDYVLDDLEKNAQKFGDWYRKEDPESQYFPTTLSEVILEFVDSAEPLVNQALKLEKELSNLYSDRKRALEIIEHEETRSY